MVIILELLIDKNQWTIWVNSTRLWPSHFQLLSHRPDGARERAKWRESENEKKGHNDKGNGSGIGRSVPIKGLTFFFSVCQVVTLSDPMNCRYNNKFELKISKIIVTHLFNVANHAAGADELLKVLLFRNVHLLLSTTFHWLTQDNFQNWSYKLFRK